MGKPKTKSRALEWRGSECCGASRAHLSPTPPLTLPLCLVCSLCRAPPCWQITPQTALAPEL